MWDKSLKTSNSPNSLDGLPFFGFETIPDGLPTADVNATQDITALCFSTKKNCLAPFKDLLSKPNSLLTCLPVTCIVYDSGMTLTLEGAQELSIPVVIFAIAGARGLMGYLRFRPFIQTGLIPLKEASYLTNGYLDIVIDWVPGMRGIQLRDFPTFIRTTDPNHIMLEFLRVEIGRFNRASAFILNSFYAFEHEVLYSLWTLLPPIYSVGRLHLQLNQIPAENELKSIGSYLWTEEPECLEWLDSKEPNSLVYANFGSITVMTEEQLIEFAWGLANSNQIFLWVIRPDLVGGESAVVPSEFSEKTKERSLLASWCLQQEVLSHPDIGFLTHSGWSSTLESVYGGVPMICWPFFADQQMICRFPCKEWGIGMEIEGDVKRDYVEGLVRKLMEAEETKEMRKKALEW